MLKNIKYHLLFFIGTLIICFILKIFFSYIEKTKDANKNGFTKLTNVKVKNSIINIGQIKTNTKNVSTSFFIYNEGPNDLFLYNIKPDCKCTVGHIEKNKMIKTGDSIPVILEYNPNVPGIFQVSAVVEANSESMPLLIMRGEVLP